MPCVIPTPLDVQLLWTESSKLFHVFQLRCFFTVTIWRQRLVGKIMDTKEMMRNMGIKWAHESTHLANPDLSPSLTITHHKIAELIPKRLRFGNSSTDITEYNSKNNLVR